MIFSEDSRVKIPCILPLGRLGYRYLSLKGATWDEETNIFPVHFSEAMLTQLRDWLLPMLMNGQVTVV